MPDPQPTQRQLIAAAQERVKSHLAKAESILPDLTDEELNYKPSPKAWSVAEVLDHLLTSLHEYYDKMDPAVRQAIETDAHAEQPYQSGMIGAWLVGAVTNHKRKIPAPKLFKPKQKGGPTRSNYTFRIVDNYLSELNALLDRLDSYEKYDLDAVRFYNPLSKLIRMKLGDAILVQTHHLVRHWGQIERVIVKQEKASQDAA